MSKIKSFFEKNWLNIVIISLFVIVALCMSRYHEKWSDEAQSWLIARDLSVFEIINYIKYEGTPPLWVFVIKIFMAFGMTYEYFFIIPIIFMTLGLIFMYTKYDIPWYVKVLFPFTYYAFFQTTIVIRSYSLMLLGICMVFYYFPRRYEKMWKFYFSLLYFMCISLHTYFVAAGFYAILLLFFVKDYKYIDPDLKKKTIKLCILIFITFLIILIMLFPNSKFGYGGNDGSDIFYIVGESTIADGNMVIRVLSTISLIFVVLYITIKNFLNTENKYEAIKEFEKLIVIFPLFILYMIINSQVRYFAILYFIIVLFLVNNKKYIVARWGLVIILMVQFVWNINSCKIDYHENYAVGEEIADFLKMVDYQDKVVDALNFHIVEISPYFEGNVFKHSFKTDDAFFPWIYDSKNAKEDELLSNKADIYIMTLLTGEMKGEETKYKKIPNVVKFMSYIDYDEYTLYSIEAKLPQKSRIREYDKFLIFVNQKVKKEIEEKGIDLKREDGKINIEEDGEIVQIFDYTHEDNIQIKYRKKGEKEWSILKN